MFYEVSVTVTQGLLGTVVGKTNQIISEGTSKVLLYLGASTALPFAVIPVGVGGIEFDGSEYAGRDIYAKTASGTVAVTFNSI